MPNIEEQNLTEFLQDVKLKMANIAFSKDADINEISDFLNESHGKFIRSQVIFLYGSNLGIKKESLIELAAASELIHLSTLIHDDIIDEADLRRNKPTVVKKWGLKKAILYGDYLYTKTFKTLNSIENHEIASVLIDCAEKLIEGEFTQIRANNALMTIDYYMEVIEKKTAVLFSGILHCLGIYSKQNQENITHLRNLGLSFGKAFQLNDDLADFNDSSSTGKTKFKDLDEGKLTFPILIVFKEMSQQEQNEFKNQINSKNFIAIKEQINERGGFKKTRDERDDAIDNCIEYTSKFIKLDNLDNMKNFLRNTLLA